MYTYRDAAMIVGQTRSGKKTLFTHVVLRRGTGCFDVTYKDLAFIKIYIEDIYMIDLHEMMNPYNTSPKEKRKAKSVVNAIKEVTPVRGFACEGRHILRNEIHFQSGLFDVNGNAAKSCVPGSNSATPARPIITTPGTGNGEKILKKIVSGSDDELKGVAVAQHLRTSPRARMSSQSISEWRQWAHATSSSISVPD